MSAIVSVVCVCAQMSDVCGLNWLMILSNSDVMNIGDAPILLLGHPSDNGRSAHHF